MRYTSNKQLNTAFRKEFKCTLDFKKLSNVIGYSKETRYHKADTRIAFVDWIDQLHRDNQISDRLVKSAYLV